MAIDAENQEKETQTQTPESPNPDAAIAGKLEALESFLGKDQVESMKKEIGVPVANKTESEEETNEEEENSENEEEAKASEEEAKKTEKKEDKKQDKQEEKKSLLGLKKPGDNKKTPELIIENTDQILDVIKSKFGQELKEIKELPKFFETAQEWRAKAQKADIAEGKYNEVLDFLSSAPEELIESLRAFEKGEDWTTPFANKPKFDFNITAEKQDIKALVNHYYPGKFTEEDLKDETPSELLQMAMDSSRDKFATEKQTRDNQRAQITQKAAEQLKAQNVSVQSSVANLKKAFPDMDADSLKEVQSTFEGGPQKVLSYFYNKDGTARADAAERLAMAFCGKEEIERMMEVSAHITETKINEDLLTRGADTKKPVKTARATDKISDKEAEQIRELERITNSTKQVF